MTEIVNLNRVRKDKRRADKKRVAENNRIRFGRTKAERKAAEAANAAREKALDGKKSTTPPDEEG
tara:strand:+ start:686 stop:880 length:195 start_codon:yes stop_codon:yes gene_type:complete